MLVISRAATPNRHWLRNIYWKSNYVLGDYEINDIEEEKEVIEELTLE